tara:strand:- start:17118 stop:18482 length:1365 start_codon:yes stop_codon:yes gene_type:complete
MNATTKNKAMSAHDYVLQSAIITSSVDTSNTTVDIKNIITDIDIYEHLDKPYITGEILFIDDANVYNYIGFSGAEFIELTFKLPDEEAVAITKKFVIEDTIKNVRSNDRTSAVLIRIVEVHAFNSTLINVNKAYQGKPVDIVQNIIRDNLGKDFSGPVQADAQSPIKVLIPNMTPLQAARWVNERATTIDGVPYYFFSTLANDKLHIIPLNLMLSTNPDPVPYVYSQITTSIAASKGIEEQAQLIQSYTSKSNDEIVSLIQKGLVGAQYKFYDPTIGSEIKNGGVTHNLDDTLQVLKSNQIIAKNQNVLTYSNNYKLNEIPVAQLKSRVVTKVVMSDVYNSKNSYSEAVDLSQHKLKVTNEALRETIIRNAIEVILPGRNFLNGAYSNTIGNQITLKFLDTAVNPSREEESLEDQKKSGDYLMYAVRHSFKNERYDVIASCVKLADLPRETNIK